MDHSREFSHNSFDDEGSRQHAEWATKRCSSEKWTSEWDEDSDDDCVAHWNEGLLDGSLSAERTGGWHASVQQQTRPSDIEFHERYTADEYLRFHRFAYYSDSYKEERLHNLKSMSVSKFYYKYETIDR